MNPAPMVVPAVQQWTGGQGEFRAGPGVQVVDSDRELLELAGQLVEELREFTGLGAVLGNGETPGPEIVLTLDSGLLLQGYGESFGPEGYHLEIGVERVVLSAPTVLGVRRGTRTLLQALAGGRALPVGTVVDWPNHPVRGFMLDVGRRFFSPEYIRDLIRLLGWFKYSELQIHLNDNGFKDKEKTADWSQVQAGFRLDTGTAFPGLASADGHYTRADWDGFEDLAAEQGITLIPELDGPAHALSLIHWRPELGLNGGDSDHLDLTRPGTVEFMKSLFDEFVPWFRSPVVHIGADEYPKEHTEEYRQYWNTMAGHVRGLGKQVRAWGSFKWMAGGDAGGYDRDVVVNCWSNQWYEPKAAVADGYRFINTNDELLYVVPTADYYHGAEGLDNDWLFENWEPHVFPGGQTVAPGAAEGAMWAVWNDIVLSPYTELDVYALVGASFPVLGQKMWSGAVDGVGYLEFTGRVSGVGIGPGMSRIGS
jgi:hypothetical protein